ncbi:glycoside hydrolase family 15 protein [Streptomyces sp. CAU 1734]|uniref:glycoside hydrolase family 15 protein n=1 Tax=Streptomyces sp. CAU 1734 TaxID=3140360 RepID=UPI003260BEB2
MASLIEDYALVGDMRTAALISRTGAVDWLCPGRFDAPAVFAGLLGGPEHGSWTLGPSPAPGTPPPPATRRRYLGNSLVLESEWTTATGVVRVTDFMTRADPGRPGQLVRIAEGIRGRVPMRSELTARYGYGTTRPRVRAEGDRTVLTAGPDALWLDAQPPTFHNDGSMLSEFAIAAGQRLSFTLTWQPSHHAPPPVPDTETVLAATLAFWRTWSARCTYTGPGRDAVIRSLITLKALTYEPTGAVVAAPTTSLPEEIGGVRNWDYRYTWLRDSAFTVGALARNGYVDEARAWRRWLLAAIGHDTENVQIMYGIDGKRDLAETELPHLPGYEASRPVRVGNAAAGQLQLDVVGEVIDALHTARANGLEHCSEAAALQVRLVRVLEKLWQRPDEGIWEVRGPRRHFVHSKVMVWVALDRTIRLIEAGEASGPVERWRTLRDEIHREVCEKGFDTVRNTFTQSYGSTGLDAALLQIPSVGFLPPNDPRVLGTITAVQHELTTGDGFLLRYTTSGDRVGGDGLPGDEGAFLACSFWLVEALAMTGRQDAAGTLFDRLLGLGSDLGLLAEEWDPAAKRQLGNYPQGLSHWAALDAARRLAAGACPRIPAPRSAESAPLAVAAP